MHLPICDALAPRPDAATEGFWAGLREGEIRAQRCSACGRMRFPELPVCPGCGSPVCSWVPLQGAPKLYSWIVVHRPSRPEISAPYTVALAAYPEGVRVAGNLIGHDDAEAPLRAGIVLEPVIAEQDGFHVPAFRVAAGAGRPPA